MTTDYSELIAVPTDSDPTCVTITGDAGVGKTTLAATWPKPIFICAEKGLRSIPEAIRPPALPMITKPDELWPQLNWLLQGEHDYKSVIIDSVTQLEVMFGDYVIANSDTKATSLARAEGGYGAGYRAVGVLHGRVRQAARLLNERRGMHVVFIAHSDVSRVDPPDGDPYNKYVLRLHEKSETHYIDNVDMVAYLRLETFLKGGKDDRVKKATSDGTRIAICHTGAAQVSKNRFGITEPVIVEPNKNPFPFIK